MSLESLSNLLATISIHYPSFRKHISNEDGTFSKHVLNEWYRLIGYMDYEEALKRFDTYLMQGNKYAPDISYFAVKRKEEPVFQSNQKHVYHLEFRDWDRQRIHGRLYDEEGREYVHNPVYEDGYHYDQMGRICIISGQVAIA